MPVSVIRLISIPQNSTRLGPPMIPCSGSGPMNAMKQDQAAVASALEAAKAGYEGLMREDLFIVPGTMHKALAASPRVLSEAALRS